jgi:UDP-glucose 4-epimerase
VLRGDGTTTRDFVFINDLCQILESVCQDLLTSEIYNVGTGSGISLFELLNTLRSLTGRPIRVRFQPQHATDVPGISLSPQKLFQEIPRFAFTSLRAGLTQVLRAMGPTRQVSQAA